MAGFADYFITEFEHARATVGVQEDFTLLQGMRRSLIAFKDAFNELSPHNRMRLNSLSEKLDTDPDEGISDLLRRASQSFEDNESRRVISLKVSTRGKASVKLPSGEEISPLRPGPLSQRQKSLDLLVSAIDSLILEQSRKKPPTARNYEAAVIVETCHRIWRDKGGKPPYSFKGTLLV